MFRRIFLTGLFLVSFSMTSCSASHDVVGNRGDNVIMRGMVRVVGNEPFSRLVLTVQDAKGGKKQKDYAIQGPLAENIRSRYQGKVIVVEGTYCSGIAAEHPSCIEPEKIIEVE